MKVEQLGLNTYKDLKELKNTLRSDRDIVGIWDNMTSDVNGRFYHRLTFQRASGGNNLEQVVIPGEGGAATFLKGTLLFKRETQGVAKRLEVFVSESGEEIVLGMREF